MENMISFFRPGNFYYASAIKFRTEERTSFQPSRSIFCLIVPSDGFYPLPSTLNLNRCHNTTFGFRSRKRSLSVWFGCHRQSFGIGKSTTSTWLAIKSSKQLRANLTSRRGEESEVCLDFPFLLYACSVSNLLCIPQGKEDITVSFHAFVLGIVPPTNLPAEIIVKLQDGLSSDTIDLYFSQALYSVHGMWAECSISLAGPIFPGSTCTFFRILRTVSKGTRAYCKFLPTSRVELSSMEPKPDLR